VTRAFRRDPVVASACLLFVLSGAAGLIYQVAWQRILALTTGVTVHSVAIITAAFLAGLGAGSHIGGRLSERLAPRQALQAFALVELGVAAFAALSAPLYYGLLYRQFPQLYAGLLTGAVTHLVTLFPPTALMGMSLPLLVRGLVRERAAAAATIGRLYGANALGAAAGALLTPWLLMRFLGVTGAVLVGAALSATAAAGALLLARGLQPGEATPSEPLAARAMSDEPPRPFRHWVALYALSGFVSLSLEIAWFRVLHVIGKDAAFAFGTLLALYLLGLAAGTFAAAGRAESLRRPLAVFLACQTGVVLVTLVAHALLVWLPAGLPGLRWLTRYGAQQVGVSLQPFDAQGFAVVYLALPLVLFGPSTFLMGYGFPVLQSAAQGDPRESGLRAGVLQAANIVGCTLGSLATGLLLLDAIGTAGVFRAMALIAAGLALLGLRWTGERRLLGILVALLLLAAVFPGNERLWRRLHGDPQQAFVEEDAASVTALTEQPGGYKMWINGRYNSWLPFGGIHTVIGALPSIAHPDPQDVAVIGLGSGDTAWGAACRKETKRLVVFEIASSQRRLLEHVAGIPLMGSLQRFLSDPRLQVVADDGRRRLRADTQRYDIIVADAIWQDVAMSGYLYSLEYYELVRNALKPGGLMCVLAKTPRVRAAVRRAFPYAVRLGDDLLLVSGEPIVIDQETWQRRAKDAVLIDYMGAFRARQLAEVASWAAYDKPAAATSELNRDLDPRDELMRPLRR
jgi:predicted membrane-bound spermidine synthase